ncbi:MAG: helix-turn-helix domain-containing protein [Betaproteobacteria bacterium]|nr:helix-turn-helix domain-containing protein [Betaproteobacteria bacterium]
MAKEPDLKDLFLDENLLIELARRELKGRLPPDQLPAQPSTLVASGKRSKLARETEGRGWTARDLAEQIGVPAAEAHALIRGGQKITPELARRLGNVFATSSEYWLSDEE